jgi:hypothetical protein
VVVPSVELRRIAQRQQDDPPCRTKAAVIKA